MLSARSVQAQKTIVCSIVFFWDVLHNSHRLDFDRDWRKRKLAAASLYKSVVWSLHSLCWDMTGLFVYFLLWSKRLWLTQRSWFVQNGACSNGSKKFDKCKVKTNCPQTVVLWKQIEPNKIWCCCSDDVEKTTAPPSRLEDLVSSHFIVGISMSRERPWRWWGFVCIDVWFKVGSWKHVKCFCKSVPVCDSAVFPTLRFRFPNFLLQTFFCWNLYRNEQFAFRIMPGLLWHMFHIFLLWTRFRLSVSSSRFFACMRTLESVTARFSIHSAVIIVCIRLHSSIRSDHKRW